MRDRIFVAGGFAQVSPERCTVLAEEAAMLADIDKQAAEERLAAAKAAMEEAKTAEDGDVKAAEKELKTAEALVAAASQA